MTCSVIGQPVARVDGRLKVTGRARYAAEFNQPNQLYAVIVNSTVGLGRVTTLDSRPAMRLPGVAAVISHLNAPRLAYKSHKGVIDPATGERLHVFQDDEVRFFGQPVAVVVADTLDRAERAASALQIRYDAAIPVTDLHDPKAVKVIATQTAAPTARVAADRERGKADVAVATASVSIDAMYSMARENHNPMEPHATIAAWSGDKVTLWSKSQYVGNEQAEIAAIFGIPLDNVQVNCPFVGGAFGTSLRTWPHVTIAALAARAVSRPVKLVLTRKQMFVATGYRPRTEQRVALGATAEGKLTGIVHEAFAETSRYEEFFEGITNQTEFLYSCPNVRTHYRIVPTDTDTPTPMRAPGEASGIYALECAMDELAVALSVDPIELRRRNEPTVDESSGRPFSSRSLQRCLALGAKQFGWAGRNPKPASMRDGRLLIGWGVASTTRGAAQAPSDALARLMPDGSAEIEVATADMGPGTYTSMTQVAADTLGLPMDRIRFVLGRSDLPMAPSHGGSWTMASVGTAVRAACLAAQTQAVALAVSDQRSPLFGVGVDQVAWVDGRLRKRGDSALGLTYGDIIGAGRPIRAKVSSSRPADVATKYSMYGHGAFFAEVAIGSDVRTVKVRRLVGVYGAGKIINPRLARSQCIGGMIGGMGMALMERTVLDPRTGRPVNAHMADYLVPVNLDIGSLEPHLLEEDDTAVNPLGVKGIAELSIVGVAPAIANAVFHATGKRVRGLPIRIESLLEERGFVEANTNHRAVGFPDHDGFCKRSGAE